MTASAQSPQPAVAADWRSDVVDCDVHATLPGPATLLDYIDDHWREHWSHGGLAIPTHYSVYPPHAPTTGAPSDLASLQAAVFGRGSAHAILSCYWAVEQPRHPDFAGALARALNDWIAAEWLARDDRLRGSIVVARDVENMVDEIDRLGPDPRFVQLVLPVRSERPYGDRSYFPVFDAAVRHGLPVMVHVGGLPGIPSTANGWPIYYVEEYVGMATVFQAQVTSLVASGVFERLPELKVVLGEGGFSWLPATMWRMTKEWRGLRREVPWVKRPPSEYVRDHMHATLSPADLPDDLDVVERLMERIGRDDFLLYSSDFPHDHGAPGNLTTERLLDALPDSLARKIAGATARTLYDFGG